MAADGGATEVPLSAWVLPPRHICPSVRHTGASINWLNAGEREVRWAAINHFESRTSAGCAVRGRCFSAVIVCMLVCECEVSRDADVSRPGRMVSTFNLARFFVLIHSWSVLVSVCSVRSFSVWLYIWWKSCWAVVVASSLKYDYYSSNYFTMM